MPDWEDLDRRGHALVYGALSEVRRLVLCGVQVQCDGFEGQAFFVQSDERRDGVGLVNWASTYRRNARGFVTGILE
ncbi:hypothetical protein PSAN_39670 [Pseudomonas antarctica]|uniref:Uncharacterized protein n=1 Tax=Pseudomonas antarctica TaxID=219572 RepID=A0ABQ6ZRM0_9PSED|nr:hypothetical protein PSAN_39670 [Pseudomonas antarctica]